MIRSLALLVLLCPTPARARQPDVRMAPLRLAAEAGGRDDAWIVSVGADLSVPLFHFLPNVGRNSHLDAMAVQVGLRVRDSETTPRYRISVLDVAISRAPWAGGVRLLSYDRAGTRDVVADWLHVHAGPSARFNIGGVSLEPRLLGGAAVATRRVGRAWFQGLPPAAARGATGAAASISIALSAGFSEAVRLEGSAGVERFYSGPRPEHRFASASLHAPVGARFEVVVRARIEREVVDGIGSDAPYFGLALRFIPSAGGY